MARGLVSSFDPRCGRGTVALRPDTAPIPFSTRRSADHASAPGDSIACRVAGGKAGVQALGVRRLTQQSQAAPGPSPGAGLP